VVTFQQQQQLHNILG